MTDVAGEAVHNGLVHWLDGVPICITYKIKNYENKMKSDEISLFGKEVSYWVSNYDFKAFVVNFVNLVEWSADDVKLIVSCGEIS